MWLFPSPRSDEDSIVKHREEVVDCGVLVQLQLDEPPASGVRLAGRTSEGT